MWRIVCLVGFVVALGAPPSEAVKVGRSGIGVFGSLNVPVANFKTWYSASPKMGVSFNYVANSRIIPEIEYHYAKMQGGDLKNRTFVWPVDKQAHNSPEVTQKMTFNSLAANALFHFRSLEEKGVKPYLMGGIGYYGYSNRVSGLIFPGQSGKTFDPTVKLNPFKDEGAAMTFAMGAGVSIPASNRLLVDVRARYNFILGELRPLEEWGILKTFPIMALDLVVGFKYFW